MSLSIFSILILVTLASCTTTGTGKETPTAPAGLRDLAVTEASTTADSVELTWSQPTDFGTTDGTTAAIFGSYTVKVYQGADEGGSEVEGLTLTPASLDESTVSVKVSGLSPDTQYAFKLVLSNGNDSPLSSDSNVVSETTKPGTAPAGLRDLAVREASTTLDSVELTWSQPTDFGTTDGTTAAAFGSYEVKVYQGADEGGSEVEGLTLEPASLDESTVSVKVSDLKSGTPYAFKLVLSNGNDFPLSSDSNVVTETTTGDPNTGKAWTKVSVKGDLFSGRYDHAVVVFKNKLWVIGGWNDYTRFDDIWSSSDGESWTEVPKSATTTRFPKREGHAAVVFKNKLWVIGGSSGEGEAGVSLNDVWSSSDGESWTEETKDVTTTRFTGRRDPVAAAFDGKLWVIGGWFDGTRYDDVWSSSDGKSWTKAPKSATIPRFSGRVAHTAVVFDNKLWVIGGVTYSAWSDEVWSSSDGKSWTKVPKSATTTRFSGRGYHTAVVFGGKIWVIGGIDEYYINDVWSSPDGKSWTEETKETKETEVLTPRFSERIGHAAAGFDGKLWVIGGRIRIGLEYKSTNEVWSSP